jgi:thiol-disulfide isomerase/thioredoxin
MKYLLLLLLPLVLLTEQVSAGDDDIRIVVNGVSNDDAVLAYYYMDKKYIHDTISFDANGIGTIEAVEQIDEGVYLLAFPSLNLRYFELILGREKGFTLETDTTDFIEMMKVVGSLENELFYDNMRFLVAQGKISKNLQDQAGELDEESNEYKAIFAKLEEMDRAMKARRKQLIQDHPEAYYTKIVQAMSDIELPANPDPSDSSWAYRYYQEHYFDQIDFSDNRLTRTPFLMRRILNFLDNYTIPLPDSINAAAERIIEMSKADYEMFQFCLVGIFNKYARSKIMAHELVYVNLAKKYYLSGEADWITEEQYNTFRERIDKLEPTLLGKPAPPIVIADKEGRVRKLYEENTGGYTILAFWNSSCGHCKQEMPKLKEIYEQELAPLGNVGIFAISTELETDEWTKFIDEYELEAGGWVHAHDPNGRNPFRYIYNIESTPVVFVLGPDKEILAKRISIEDIRNLIEYDMGSRD